LAEVSFGEWLRHQRKAAGLTQQQLALQISCSTSALKKIEAEARHPSVQIIERLAELFTIPQNERKAFLRFARGDWQAIPSKVLEGTPWLLPSHEAQVSASNRRSALPTGTVTFLYTDIEGSTQLWKQHRQAMVTAHARHDQILRQAIESHNGYIFQVVGDAFCAAFPTAAEAVRAAVKSQMELNAKNWGETPIWVRMGIHTGNAEVQQDGSYSGFITLSHVQRLMSVAHGGQVLLSFTAQELVQDELPENVQLRDMGQRQLKDWSRPEHICQLVISGLRADFPPLSTPESFPHNLPVQLTSFIGREREMAEVKQLLSNTRLLTFTGPGGTGKTRLALQIAEELLPSFADGVWLAESAPLTDASFLYQTIAGIFGLRELPNVPILNIITDYLRAKRLLLILDNCEHLIEACAKLSDHLLHACPQLKIIASSREALGIAGETAYRVPSLSLPDQAQVTREAVLGFESVQLFVERASAANPKFHLTENASDVAQICRRLDGIPLALELAAARIRIFSTEEIADRLDDRFSLLTGGSRTAMERHQTLRALIDWSYELLSHDERRLFRHLAVFAGGWTFEAAEAVCPNLDVLNLLTQLVDKSLVMVDEQESSTRYHLLETICQYASEKLLEMSESHQARARHVGFFLKFAEVAEPHLHGPQEREWLSRLETEYDNLRAALEWAMKNDIIIALRLETALYLFWNRHGYQAEGRRLLGEALARLQRLPKVEGMASDQRIALQARALNAFGSLGFAVGDLVGSLKIFEESIGLSRQIGEKYSLAQALTSFGYAKAFLGDAEDSYRAAEEGLTLAREVGDKFLLGMALRNMASATVVTHGDPKVMRAYAEESLQLYRELGSRWDYAMAVFGMGLSATRQGDYAEARSRFETCLRLFTELGDRNHVNGIQSELAHLERRQGHFAQAKLLYRETLLEWQRLGHRAAIAHELECLAMIAKAQEDDRRAARLFGAAEILRENIHIPMTPSEHVEYEREVNDLRANMEEAAFIKAWADGRAMSMEQAILLATANESNSE
jgi:predicted ATPase/class 3 adenylate cyclase/DNA-binding XRE family transcriptional regulator